MKLTLARFRDLSILIATGPISVDRFTVLRAGIKKLFREGKNRIILELPDAENFPPDVLRELAALNLIASEMAGQIVLAKIEPLVRMKIEAFAKPPVVRCFRTREDAVIFFHPAAKDELQEVAQVSAKKTAPASAPVSAPPPASPPTPAADVPPAPAQSHLPSSGEMAAHASKTVGPSAAPVPAVSKEDIRNREIGDLNAARNRISTLENENAHLQTQLEQLVIKRREAPDLQAAQEKIITLQKQVDDLVTQINAATKKA